MRETWDVNAGGVGATKCKGKVDGGGADNYVLLAFRLVARWEVE